MSASTATAPSPSPRAGPPYGAPPRPDLAPVTRRGPWGRLVTGLQGSPGRLRLVAALTALVVTAFGLVAANALWSSSGALERADLNLTQLVRVQGIQSDLLQADASATNAFLAGGVEPAAQRQAYDAAVARVTAGIAEAASAQPADALALGALNGQVQQYTAQVEQARALNRQELTVGSTYLRNASDSLRATGMPTLDALTTANQTRLATEIRASSSGSALTVVGLVALVVLGLALLELARRSHRYVSVPLAVGAGLVVVALVAGVAGLGSVGDAVGRARDGSVAATTALAQVRALAFDAKADESLTLILQGPAGDVYEQTWGVDDQRIRDTITSMTTAPAAGLQTTWKTYTERHRAIRAIAGDEQARTAAAATGAGSANAAFGAFVATVSQRLEQQQQAAGAALTAPRTTTTLLGWLVLVLALAAAGLALRGVAERLEEYR